MISVTNLFSLVVLFYALQPISVKSKVLSDYTLTFLMRSSACIQYLVEQRLACTCLDYFLISFGLAQRFSPLSFFVLLLTILGLCFMPTFVVNKYTKKPNDYRLYKYFLESQKKTLYFCHNFLGATLGALKLALSFSLLDV